MENFVNVNKEYQKLVRVLKKYTIHKDYIYANGEICFWPASQEAIEILDNGYYGM